MQNEPKDQDLKLLCYKLSPTKSLNLREVIFSPSIQYFRRASNIKLFLLPASFNLLDAKKFKVILGLTVIVVVELGFKFGSFYVDFALMQNETKDQDLDLFAKKLKNKLNFPKLVPLDSLLLLKQGNV